MFPLTNGQRVIRMCLVLGRHYQTKKGISMKTITCACGGTFKPFHIIGPDVDCKDGGTLTFRNGECVSHELRVVCDRCNLIAYCELQAAPVRT
jgi:hypothetical protein